MPRPRTAQSLTEVIDNALGGVVTRICGRLAASIEQMAAAEVARRLGVVSKRGGRTGRRRSPRGRRRPSELSRWVTDKRARRVPKFVIEATGLDTKKKIVAKYGDNVAFEKGKPLPKPNPSAAKTSAAPDARRNAAARVVRAKPPIVRKGVALRRAM